MRLATLGFSAAVLFAVSVLPSAAQDAQQQPIPPELAAIKAQLRELRVNPYPPPRERAAQLLVAYVRRIDVSIVDSATIDEIAGLLDDKSDSVRGRMAIALGLIGPAAKGKVPALVKAFEKAKAYLAETQSKGFGATGLPNYGLGTSADSICFALGKLEAPAPMGCVDGRYESPAAQAPSEPAPAN